jgi:hypothetical protein
MHPYQARRTRKQIGRLEEIFVYLVFFVVHLSQT